MNTTIKLPSQIGANKPSLGFLSNNQSNILDQADGLSKDDSSPCRRQVFTLPIQISNFNEFQKQ